MNDQTLPLFTCRTAGDSARSWLALATLLWVLPAAAANLPISNTGTDAFGNALPAGAVDPNWTIVAGPITTHPAPAYVETSPPLVYVVSPDSKWIWADADGTAAYNTAYTFQTRFDLSGYDAQTAVLSGSWAVDNNGAVLLNGAAAIGTGTTSIVGLPNTAFTTLHPFTLSGGFLPGINTLQFQVVDTGSVGGLNVSGLTVTAAAVPETGTVPLLLAGLLAVGLTWRRQSTRSQRRDGRAEEATGPAAAPDPDSSAGARPAAPLR